MQKPLKKLFRDKKIRLPSSGSRMKSSIHRLIRQWQCKDVDPSKE